jgi:hypothetical protein
MTAPEIRPAIPRRHRRSHAIPPVDDAAMDGLCCIRRRNDGCHAPPLGALVLVLGLESHRIGRHGNRGPRNRHESTGKCSDGQVDSGQPGELEDRTGLAKPHVATTEVNKIESPHRARV